MAQLRHAGIWQGCLMGSVLVRPDEEMCRTKVRTRSVAKKWQASGRGNSRQIIPSHSRGNAGLRGEGEVQPPLPLSLAKRCLVPVPGRAWGCGK